MVRRLIRWLWPHRWFPRDLSTTQPATPLSMSARVSDPGTVRVGAGLKRH